MKKASWILLITLILVLQLSGCGGKEEPKVQEAVTIETTEEATAEAPEEVKEEIYHTEEHCGCKFSVPDDWKKGTYKDNTIYYVCEDTDSLVFVEFDPINTEGKDWGAVVELLAKHVNENSDMQIDKYESLDGLKYKTHILNGSATINGASFPLEGYFVNLDDIGVLYVRNTSSDIQRESAHLRTIINTLDASGVADYIASSSASGQAGTPSMESDKQEKEQSAELEDTDTKEEEDEEVETIVTEGSAEEPEAEEKAEEPSNNDAEYSQPKKEGTYYSTNDPETAKLGNSGKFAYIKKGPNYDTYYIIDFDEGFVYRFLYGQGDESGELYTIDSGDLNSGLYITYYTSDSDSEFTDILHFHYVNSPSTLIEVHDYEETKYQATSIDPALRLKNKYEFPEH